jgi:hypothetical protein
MSSTFKGIAAVLCFSAGLGAALPLKGSETAAHLPLSIGAAHEGQPSLQGAETREPPSQADNACQAVCVLISAGV